eukprot:1159426-Pelagomonas_calceolata.AAC.2
MQATTACCWRCCWRAAISAADVGQAVALYLAAAGWPTSAGRLDTLTAGSLLWHPETTSMAHTANRLLSGRGHGGGGPSACKPTHLHTNLLTCAGCSLCSVPVDGMVATRRGWQRGERRGVERPLAGSPPTGLPCCAAEGRCRADADLDANMLKPTP